MERDVLPPGRSTATPLAKPPARALAATVLVYTLLGVLAVTLAPFEFRAPQTLRFEWSASGFEFVANCALLVIPGFLFRAVTGSNRDLYCIGPAILGVLFALGIELAQAAIPGRCMSVIDMATNGAGAWFGAMCYDSARRHLDKRVAGKMLLELPLMGLVYLLVPMLWLDGFASIGHARRIALALPLGILGAIVLAAVWHHRLRHAKVLSANGAAVLAALWFAVAGAPILRHDPAELAVLTLVVGAVTRAALALPRFLAGDGQRFEVPTLRRVFPFFLVYVTVLGLWPFDVVRQLTDPSVALQWRGEWGLGQLGHPPSLIEIARLLEWMAAFTLGGYIVAEWLGRVDAWAARRMLRSTVPWFVVAAVFELIRGFAPDTKASLLRFGFAACGAAFGAAIYGLQLDAVRAHFAPPDPESLRTPIPLAPGQRDAPATMPQPAGAERAPSYPVYAEAQSGVD